MKKLSDQEKINIVEEYKSGISSIELSRKYKVSKQSILSVLKVRKVKIRNGK